jgi:hypothetical protein
VDPDQDLLDRLDRKEGPSRSTVIMLSAGFAVFAAAVAYFTLILTMHATKEVAGDTAILIFIASAVALGTGYLRLH